MDICFGHSGACERANPGSLAKNTIEIEPMCNRASDIWLFERSGM